MFELYKNVNIDLSHLIGLTDISKNYEVIDSGNKYEHRSIINIDTDRYDLYYLSNDKLIVKFNGELFFFELRNTETPNSENEYNVILDKLSNNIIEFEDELGSAIFKSLTNGELLYGTEYLKESIEEELVDTEYDIILHILESDHEYMFNLINEGETLMYIGVKINEGKIL